MYKSKIDRFFITMYIGSIILINVIFLMPYLLKLVNDIKVTWLEIVLMAGFLLFSILLFLWFLLGIRYEFHADYLFVKGGPFRSKIRYEHITKATVTYFSIGDALTGYRAMASRDGIEIDYKIGMLGCIRISPDSKEQFVEDLKKRVPHVEYIEVNS